MGEYLSGYEEKPDPGFIFNVAQCQRLLGHPGPALQSYRRYLNEAPEGAGRVIAERQAAELEQLLGSGDKPPAHAEGAGLAPPAVSSAALAPPSAAAPPTSEVAPVRPAAQPEPAISLVTSAEAPLAGPLPALPATAIQAPPDPRTSEVSAARTEAERRPVYERWWFWAATSAVSVFAVVAVASSGGRPACDIGRMCR